MCFDCLMEVILVAVLKRMAQARIMRIEKIKRSFMRVLVVLFAFLFSVQCLFADDSYTEDSYTEDSYIENPYMQDLEENNQAFDVRHKDIIEKVERGIDELIQAKNTDTLSAGLQELLNVALDEASSKDELQYKKAACSGTNDIICEITELTLSNKRGYDAYDNSGIKDSKSYQSTDKFSYNITFRLNATNPKKVQFMLKIKESGKSHFTDKNIAFVIPRLYEWNLTMQYAKGLVAFIDTHTLRASGYTMNLSFKSDMKDTLFGDSFLTTLAKLKNEKTIDEFLKLADVSSDLDKALESKDAQHRKGLLQNDSRIHSIQWSASGELMESLYRLYRIFNMNDEIDTLQKLREYGIEKLMATKAGIDGGFERAKREARNMGVKPTSLPAWQGIIHNAIDSMRNVLSQKRSAITFAITAKQNTPFLYATIFEWRDKMEKIDTLPTSPDKKKRQEQYIIDLLQFILDTYEFRIDNRTE